MFPSGMRTYHDGMPDISHTSSEIVSMLSNREVKKLPLIYYSRILVTIFFSFCSLVDKRDLLNQYPNADDLIKKLPASSSAGCKCFKPEAHLLIKKFLSLQTENSRFLYIANLVQHTRARREVSSGIEVLEECSSTLYFDP